MRLKGQGAIVTGAASGIGKGIAMAFAKEGAHVTIADLDEKGATEVVREIEGLGVKGLAVKTDITDGQQIRAMVNQTISAFGGVNILVNNAGIQKVAPIVELEDSAWNLMIAIHLTGTFLCTKAVLPAMLKQKSGRIINISSVHGKIASKFKAPYVSAKHGVIGFTKVLALEVAESGITANAICPGYVLTPLVEKQIPEQAKAHKMSEKEVIEKVLLKDVPQKRFISVEECGELAVYLASEAGSGITGQAINLSGGWAMH